MRYIAWSGTGRRIVALAASAALVLGGLAMTGGSASAGTSAPADVPVSENVRLISSPPPIGVNGECDLGGLLCGHIYNDDDLYTFIITDNWGRYSDSATWHWLSPGQSSAEIGVKDADGFRVGTGCWATVAFVQRLGPGWYKVYNGQHIHVTDFGC